jgi:hypothetical protein
MPDSQTSNKKAPASLPIPGTPAAEALLAKLEAGFPESWQPTEAGDTIVGTFLRLESGRTKYGPAPVVVLATDEGERSVWLFFEALKSGFRRAQPAPGEQIAVRYLGEQTVKNPSPGRRDSYHDFRVAVDRPATATAPVDWGAALPEDGAPGPFSPEPATSDVPY